MDNCCQDKACELEALRTSQSKVLWLVLGINAVMFGVELISGLLAGSLALQADSLDMLGDAIVYGFSLYAIAKSARWRTSAALLKGGIMALFGFAVLGQCLYRLAFPEVPAVGLMGATGFVALLANGFCLFLLTRHKSDDLNMRSTWLCSRNDIIANSGVLLASVLVLLSSTTWPDLVVSLIITGLFLQSAWQVLRQGLAELRLQATASGQHSS